MRVKHYDDSVIAVTKGSDDAGRTVIEWHDAAGNPTGVKCDGWIEGDALFAPADGQSSPGYNFEDDGSPWRGARWYRVDTGSPAIFGVPHAVMVTLP